MASIDTLLQQILTAVYGEDVRGSIHDAIAAMNEESSEAISVSKTAQDSAKNSADAAAKSATDAADAVADLDNKHTSAVDAVIAAKTDALSAISVDRKSAEDAITADLSAAQMAIANDKLDALTAISNEKTSSVDVVIAEKNTSLGEIDDKTAASVNALTNISNSTEAFKTLAQSYAEGGTGTRDGEDTANAKYYMEQAQKIASGGITVDSFLNPTSVNPVQNKVITASLDKMSSYVDTQLDYKADKTALPSTATTDAEGLVKFDGTTIIQNGDGQLSVPIDSEMLDESSKPVENKVAKKYVDDFKEAIAESEFLAQYELANESTTIAKDSDDNSVITETKSNGVATTNFAKTDDTTTITTKVVPTAGDYNYTQTTTITKSEDGTTSITSSYTKEAKAA